MRLFEKRILRLRDFSLVADVSGMSGLVFLHQILVQDIYAFPALEQDKSVRVLFDAGANCGFFAITRCQKHPYWRAYCFEPHPITFDRLRENIALNGLTDRVFPINAALGASNGQCELEISAQSSMGVVSTSTVRLMDRDHRAMTTSKVTVQLLTLDEFAARERVCPDVLKIDVEGFEVEVLRGAPTCLKAARYAIIEWDSEDLRAEMKAMLSTAGFETAERGPIIFAQNV
jgi:FkbM family methyltransferase